MSSASQFLGTNQITARSDFWELTNFGTNTLDLTGYRFSDSAGIGGAEGAMFNGLTIGAGESIIFAKEEINSCCKTAAEFRAWWGATHLPPSLQVYFYTGYGFSGDSDAVQLWRLTGGRTQLVQRVDLFQARRGYSFTYDPATGWLDAFSEIGETNVFKAEETDDVGSPGSTAGPAPLLIIRQPENLTVDAGSPARFSILASGLPRAHFQWRFNGTPIAGATSNALEISATEPAHEGTYTVELTNGLMNVLSAPAILQVNTDPSPPSIVVPPIDLVVTPSQTAVFHVNARGYPLPTFQWRFNSEDIPGATGASLFVPNVDFADAGIYSVHIQNSLGSTNAAAVLAVQPKPNLRITEIMGGTSTNSTVSGRADWWELTNFDPTTAFNLRGYRFDDFPGLLEGAVAITNDLIIQPGESVLFIQDMTAEFFAHWWGEENLPENVQFVRYAGNGFRATGDMLVLWNATALDESDFIDSVGYINLSLEDSSPLRGVSLTYWPDRFWEEGTNSILGNWGTITAASSADIGSPAYITNHPPRPRAVEILRDPQGVHLTWRIRSGNHYALEGKDALEAATWTHLSQHVATNSLLILSDLTATNAARRFYRLRLVPQPE